jgi:hypothetical protein
MMSSSVLMPTPLPALDVDELALANQVKRSCWQVTLCVLTLLQKSHSATGGHSAYMVAPQLLQLLMSYLSRIERFSATSAAANGAIVPPVAAAPSADPSPAAVADRSRPEQMLDNNTFPLQTENPLYARSREFDEIVYRVIDILHVLTAMARTTSVCGTDALISLLKHLRYERSSTATTPLPPIVSVSLIRFLRKELPHHSPLVHQTAPDGAPISIDLAKELLAVYASHSV